MIDSHAHIDFPDFDEIRTQMLERFFDAGGEKIVNVGCDMKSSERSVKLAKENERIFAAVGIHPHDADLATEENLAQLEKLLLKYKTIAVGEIGLDFFEKPRHTAEIQERALRAQLELAENHDFPVILHCREAYLELLDILKSYKTSNWHGVLHCFTASPEIAQEFLDIGFYVGFTGIITFYKTDSKDYFILRETLQNLPQDKILVETDSPYLSPVPHRGEINEPLFVKYVINKIAEIRETDPKEVEQFTSRNAEKLFGI